MPQVPVELPSALQSIFLLQLRQRGRQPAPTAICSRAHVLQDFSVLPQLHHTSRAGPDICIEIKPKCGFLPTADTICPRNVVKKRVPRFTLHQALKLLKASFHGTSYCTNLAYSEYSQWHSISRHCARAYFGAAARHSRIVYDILCITCVW